MTDMLKEIFDRQLEYMLSLKSIYEANGFTFPIPPYDLDDRHNQEKFRVTAWRIVEEIHEARQALVFGFPRWDFVEELADILHFIVELGIITGIKVSQLESLEYLFASASIMEPRSALDQVVRTLSEGIRVFKQRPWRTDSRPTDISKWEGWWEETLKDFIIACKSNGLTAEELYQAYFNKSKINDQRRQETLGL